MTVITVVISRHYIAHATDSQVSVMQVDGTYLPIDLESSKIVCINHWRGIMSCWGLAQIGNNSTMNWLSFRAGEARQFQNPEDFATHIASELNSAISRMTFLSPLDAGIGIHFTAYEYIDDFLIPELFQITNYEDPASDGEAPYQRLHSDGVRVRRETFGTLTKGENEISHHSQHGESRFRHRVRDLLNQGRILFYNNGDPQSANVAISGILHTIQIAADRNVLELGNDSKHYRSLAEFPIRQVTLLQKMFFKEGYRFVGGAIHSVSVSPSEESTSDTGDC